MKDSEMMVLIERAIAIHEVLNAVKPMYKERDEIMNKLIDAKMPVSVELKDYVVVLKDNFASKNVSWKACGVSRFELEVTPRIGAGSERVRIDPFKIRKRDE